MHHILIVDDEPTSREILEKFLGGQGYRTSTAETRRQAEDMLRNNAYDAAVFDHQLPDGNALELLQWLEAQDIDLPVIILTGHASIDLAVQAIKHGAEQFLTKPVDLPVFQVVIRRILENRRNKRQQQIHRAKRSADTLDPFVGASEAIGKLRRVAERLALSDSPILIHGETGSGKGVLARWLHEHGPRNQEAFIDINCAGLSHEFLDSELFGHQRGAFTGATTHKQGLLEVGNRGTIFLDEIGDVDLRVQPKLLKVLEEKRFRRMGEVREREVDIRLIAASHHDLRILTQDGRFREDLYFRISTLPLEIPPLRERREDILPLAEKIVRRFAAHFGRPVASFTDHAVKSLEEYSWPGNIRELSNVLERALLLSGSEALEPGDLHFELSGPAESPSFLERLLPLEEVERRHIEFVMNHVEGSVSQAARILGISRTTLYQKLKI